MKSMQQQFQIGDYHIDTRNFIVIGAMVYNCTRIHQNYEEECVVKIVQQAHKPNIDILNKIKQNQCQNIIRIYDIYENEEATYIFMEKCENNLQMEFRYMLQQGIWYDQKQQIQIIQQILKGYEELYKMNIFHRNIKPENILLTHSKICKISGFSLSETCNDFEKLQSDIKVGTLAYGSPQVFVTDELFSGKSDIYSLGIIFYNICFKNQFPYDRLTAQSIRKFLIDLKDNPIKCLVPEGPHSHLLQYLLEKMIVYTEENRIAFKDLFQHPLMEI